MNDSFTLTGYDLEIIMIALAEHAVNPMVGVGEAGDTFQLIRKLERMYEMPTEESWWDRQ